MGGEGGLEINYGDAKPASLATLVSSMNQDSSLRPISRKTVIICGSVFSFIVPKRCRN
jgi:hypothetical protein